MSICSQWENIYSYWEHLQLVGRSESGENKGGNNQDLPKGVMGLMANNQAVTGENKQGSGGNDPHILELGGFGLAQAGQRQHSQR